MLIYNFNFKRITLLCFLYLYIKNEDLYLIKLKNILNEGLSQILFHFTNIGNLINILNENKFRTNKSFQRINGKFIDMGYFFSTTRIRSSGFYGANDMSVCIVLDGRKLNTKYKGTPFEYFQDLSYFSKTKKYTQKDYIDALKQLEQEDRIVTTKPDIPSAISYIIEINLLIPKNLSSKDDLYGHYNTFKTAIFLCEENNIPVFVYDEKKYFKYNIKSKAIDFNQI